MSIYDFSEEFLLYERVRTPDGKGGFVSSWEEGSVFFAALTSGRSEEARLESVYSGSAQKFDTAATFSLYVISDTDDYSVRPTYDDFVKRLDSGETYRIISRPEDRKTPDIASIKFFVLTLVRASLPMDAGVGGYV